MRRICIYLTYDNQKIVDAYIGYMLKELKECVEYLVVICNESNVIKGIENLQKYADNIYYRDNIGYDAGGFKDALCNLVGWHKVLQFDELVLVNDSMFGPFKSMQSIFFEMEEKNVDFWGLIKHGKFEENGVSYFSEHIQSYFLIVRSKMLHSIQFKNYWEQMPFYSNFSDVVYKHEVKFTQYFKKLGYTYDTLANTEINDSISNPANNYMQYGRISYELIKKRNFPFFKKQQIAYNTLSDQTQENLFQSIDFIEKETNYDVNLIWENIIRTLNMADLQRSLHLQYIIFEKKERANKKRNIAIIIFAEYEESVEYILEYLNQLSDHLRHFIYVLSERKDILEAYQSYGIKGIMLPIEQEYSIEMLSSKDYVCVLHDTDMTSDITPSCIGKSYFYCIWNNLLKNNNYILGIIDKFEKNGRLGFLAPPQPNFAEYFGNMCGGWNGNYERIERIIRRLNLNCPISEEKPPYRVTNDFWIRGNILERLKDLEIEDYQYMPYLWSYFAQDAGYYSGIVESPEYAAMNEANLQYYLQETAAQIRKYIGGFQYFYEMKDSIFILALEQYCKRHKKIMIYGTGKAAEEHRKYISNAECFLVSDGQIKQEKFHGLPVKYLSEISVLEEYGIVLCLNEKNQKEVIPLLKRQGVQDYFCI